MSKHTPGPWKAVSSGVSAQIDCMEIAEVSHMRVIPASGGWPTPGEPEDDARLIAAAPDLLQSCKMALEALEALQGGCTDSDDGTVEALTVWCPEVIESLTAAIAKATGEQP